jgi:hypothetical protein
MWNRMLDAVEAYRTGNLSLDRLVADLRGYFIEADPHDHSVRSDFELMWSRIDGELELRTELWAPAGAASDENLTRQLTHFSEWVKAVLPPTEPRNTTRSADRRLWRSGRWKAGEQRAC